MRLTEPQRLLLCASAAGGPSPIRPVGAGNWRTARNLVAQGLGRIDGRTFTATDAGMAAIAEQEAAR